MSDEVPSGDKAVFAFLEVIALAFAFEGVAALLRGEVRSFILSLIGAVFFFVAGVKWPWIRGILAGLGISKRNVSTAALILMVAGVSIYGTRKYMLLRSPMLNRPWLFLDGLQIDKTTGEVHMAFTNKRLDPAQHVKEKRWTQWGRMAVSLQNGHLSNNGQTFIKEGDNPGNYVSTDAGTLGPKESFVDIWFAPHLDYPVVQTVGTVTYTDTSGLSSYMVKFCFQTAQATSTDPKENKSEWIIFNCRQEGANESR